MNVYKFVYSEYDSCDFRFIVSDCLDNAISQFEDHRRNIFNNCELTFTVTNRNDSKRDVDFKWIITEKNKVTESYTIDTEYWIAEYPFEVDRVY